MKKLILIIMLTIVANIGEGQTTTDPCQTYVDTLRLTYTGSLNSQEQIILRMIKNIIPCYYHNNSYKDEWIDGVCNEPLVSSFISEIADDLQSYLKKHAEFVRMDTDFFGDKVPLYSIPGSLNFRYYCMRGDKLSTKEYAKKYVKVLCQMKFPGLFDDHFPIEIKWQKYLNSEDLEKKAQAAAACGSLKKVCTQNGFYNETLAYNVATHNCLKMLYNCLNTSEYENEEYGKKVAFVIDCIETVNKLKAEETLMNRGIVRMLREEARKQIIQLFK